MQDDDAPIGRILSRREVPSLLGGGGIALLVACSDTKSPAGAPTGTEAPAPSAAAAAADAPPQPIAASASLPACVVRPAQTEGPYFVDEKLNRSDIRSDPSDGSVRDGMPLLLTFNVSSMAANACASLGGATIDIWHCDSQGIYSDARDQGFNTIGKKFLRGYQVTDASGKAQFTTIYPGWYQGRAVHIHFKIRTPGANGKTNDFTSQLFFDDAMNAAVFAAAPYNSRAPRWMKNAEDGIYRDGGARLLLQPTKGGAGYAATFDIGLQVG